jgi:hypothetical protein
VAPVNAATAMAGKKFPVVLVAPKLALISPDRREGQTCFSLFAFCRARPLAVAK